jgi:hypothetical protein
MFTAWQGVQRDYSKFRTNVKYKTISEGRMKNLSDFVNLIKQGDDMT